jgi:hypothetical protein
MVAFSNVLSIVSQSHFSVGASVTISTISSLVSVESYFSAALIIKSFKVLKRTEEIIILHDQPAGKTWRQFQFS